MSAWLASSSFLAVGVLLFLSHIISLPMTISHDGAWPSAEYSDLVLRDRTNLSLLLIAKSAAGHGENASCFSFSTVGRRQSLWHGADGSPGARSSHWA
jgi:hypothetical protein